jgi:hypothetical protein
VKLLTIADRAKQRHAMNVTAKAIDSAQQPIASCAEDFLTLVFFLEGEVVCHIL